MEFFYFTKVLLLLSITLNVLAYKRPATKRENSPFSDDLLTSETKNEGFFEDINFKSFFEDVGLKSSDSAPKLVRHQEPVHRRDRYQLQGQAQTNDYGFLPAEPLFKPAESRNRFTVISSDDDFFAQESSPFEDFYGFDSSPFAASQNHRDYISPYSESRQSENFADYGLPKGFFDHDFSADFSGGGGGNKNNNDKATQESKNEPKYGNEPSQKEKDKTKKCETVHKDKMTCEVCKDEFGGFSEHCSHSLHSGKDQKYANSRRNAHEDTYNPLNNQGNQGNQGGHKDGASSINNRAYQNDKENELHTPNEDSTTYGKKSTDVQLESGNNFENPVKEDKEIIENNKEASINDRVVNEEEKVPEKYEKETKVDGNNEVEIAIFARKSPVNDAYSGSQHSRTAPKKDNQNNFYDHFPQHTEKQASNKAPQQNEAEPAKHKIPIGHPNLPQYQPAYKQMNPVQNFQVLGKMVQNFGKKDRTNCKKRVTKKGMTCYVCPNKNGQVEEECMYENKDPSQGVHMMYKEEVTY